jgi:UDP-GlcNAc:undecaprenyl-phosphate GlcNAc-1-phosphate transferase
MQSGVSFCDFCVGLVSQYWALPLIIGWACTLLVCHFARPIGESLGLMDDPARKCHSRHADPVPLVGGLAVLLPVVFLSLVAGVIAQFMHQPTYCDISAVFAAAVGVMTGVGLLDDRYHLSVRSRLLVTSVLFAVVVLMIPQFRIEDLIIPFVGTALSISFSWAAAPFTVLCLVALANAVNMADGRNGLVIGMALIWTLAFISAAPTELPRGMLMLLVSLLVAFAYNIRGKLFLGDGGTYGLAAAFGLTAVWFHRYDGGLLSEAQISSLFLIPGFDMVRLIVSRRRRGASPFAADHDHLHHHLDDWIGWRRGLLVYLGLVAVPVVLAFSVPNWGGEALLFGAAAYLAVLATARHRAALLRSALQRSAVKAA